MGIEEIKNGVVTSYDIEQDMKLKQQEYEIKGLKHYVDNQQSIISGNREMFKDMHDKYMSTILEMKGELMSLKHENARLHDNLTHQADGHKKFENFVYGKFKVISELKEWKANVQALNWVYGIVVAGFIGMIVYNVGESQFNKLFQGDKPSIDTVLEKGK